MKSHSIGCALALVFGLVFAAPAAYAEQVTVVDGADVSKTSLVESIVNTPEEASSDDVSTSEGATAPTEEVDKIESGESDKASTSDEAPTASEATKEDSSDQHQGDASANKPDENSATSTEETPAPTPAPTEENPSVTTEATAAVDQVVTPTDTKVGTLSVAAPISAPAKADVATQVKAAANPLGIVLSQIFTTNDVISFASALKSSLVVDIAGGSTSKGANVQMYGSNNTLAQYFKVQWLGDGWYTFFNLKSGLVLDVSGASSKNGTNVAQYTSNGTSAQKWALIRNSDGSYSLVPYCATNTRLDISGASTANGANVQIYAANGTSAQRFFLRKDTWLTNAAKLAQPSPLSNGVYTIASAGSNNYVVDISSASTANGANTQVWADNNSSAQKFLARYQGNGLYVFECLASGKVLDVSGASTANGANIQQYEANGTKAQLWYLEKHAASGAFIIHSANSGKVMDVSGASFKSGTNIHQYVANGTVAQRFFIGESNLIGNGIYVIQTAIHDSLVLDISAASKNNGGNLQIYSSNGTAAQKFKITYLGNGLYSIMNVGSGKYLDVAGAGKTDGTNVQQYQWNNTDAQKWKVSYNNGRYTFTSACNGRVLDISGGLRGLGTNVQVFQSNGTKAQCFRLKSSDWVYQFTDHLNGIDISHWQDGLNLSAVDAQFVLFKATQGTHYKDPSMASWANQAMDMGKLFGLYHFADGDNAVNEANYFVNDILPYIGHAVLVLDWEAGVVNRGVGYAKTWLDTVYSRTGVKPLIYMSNSVVNSYDWSSVANAGYGLWNAGYVYGYNGVYGYQPYAPMKGGAGAWGWPTMYQYTSSGHIGGYGSNLDLDVFYGTESDWNQLASRR